MNIWTQTRMGFHSNSDAFYDSMKLLSLADYWLVDGKGISNCLTTSIAESQSTLEGSLSLIMNLIRVKQEEIKITW
jgi:hypothetical protein